MLTTLPADPATIDDLVTIAQAWDANNNLVETVETFSASGAQVTTRSYDAFDRLETVTDRWGRTLRHGYDADGNRERLTDPAGAVTVYAYDELNRMVSVTAGGGTTEYRYLRDSRLSEVRHPNGTRATTTYSPAGRTAAITNTHNGVLVSSYAYRYDRNGNRVKQIETRGGDPAETTTYAYDLADRLEAVTYPDRTVTYTYDPVGNRRSEVATSTSGHSLAHRTYTYDVRDRLESVADALDATASVTYTYDANGNQVRRETGAGAVTDFVFDVLDRMVRVEEQGLPVGTYRYDATGLRVEKLTAHGVSRYLYDQQSVLTREDAGGVTKYDYGPDRLLSVADPIEGRAFYLHDTLGSIVDLTTAAGIHLASYQYDAWGNYVEKRDTDANPFGFTGHEHDQESGLVYAKARFYDPQLGRSLSTDPWEGSRDTPPSLHRYLYAFQNPLAWVDPTGREPEAPDDSILVAPGDPVPEGYQQVGSGDLSTFRTAVPIPEEEEPSLLDRTLERLDGLFGFTEAGSGISDAVDRVGEVLDTLDQGLRRQDRAVTEEQASNSRLGQNRGVQEVKEAADSVGVAVKASAVAAVRVVDTADRVVTTVTIAGAVAVLGTTVVKKLLREGGKEAVDEAVRRETRRRATSSMGSEGAETAETAFRASASEATRRNALPSGESQLRHIFRDAPGHLTDTPANRSLLQNVADDPATTLGADRFGNV